LSERISHPLNLRRLVIALTMIAAACIVMPQVATASCGDWLAHPAGHSLSNHVQDGLSGGTAGPVERGEIPKPPCRGPSCSGGDSLPVVPPNRIPVPERIDDAALLAVVAEVDSELFTAFFHGDRQHPDAGHHPGIERPPQS